ncbi:hypothetical protein P691DRAFT_494618 [Macrolepiota fuliginosa MF-IS2]|uniref:Uncharacterized protein n=1 Tax=Macrolepiota fuliginosa MF-IS2 TaxID=1400762 RepID=A0A9P5XI82_9AGAR|nr:hypothetical protein P691DRAFT_494618 [Macrolepiota fuliginosa MF-IS2]
MAFLQHYYYCFLQLIFLVDCTHSVPVLGRPGIPRVIIQRDEQHISGLFSRGISPNSATPLWVYPIIPISSVLVTWAIYPGVIRGFIRWIQDRIRGRRRGGGFNALESIAPEVETSYNPGRENRRPVLLPAHAPPILPSEHGQEPHKTLFRSSSMPAPAITVTPTDPNSSPQMYSAGTATTPLRHNSWTPLDVLQSPEIPAGSGSGLLARGAPSSSSSSTSLPPSPSSPSPTPADISYQSQSHLQTAPGMIPTRASSPRLKPIRAAPTPSPRSSMDVTSVNDRSPSLAEFPVPPPRPSSYSANILSPLVYSPGDLGTPRNIQSLASPSEADTPDIIDGDPSLPSLPSSRRGGSPEYGPPSTTSTRPPTYYGSWHRSTPSQSSFSTLPAYPGIEEDGDDGSRLSRISRAPTYRSSITSLRGPRTPRTRPPLPVPPLPSDPPK